MTDQFDVLEWLRLREQDELVKRLREYGDSGDREYAIRMIVNGHQAANALEAQAARIDELEAAQAWQPIETAPKDGGLILAVNKDNSEQIASIVYWCISDGGAGYGAGPIWRLSSHEIADIDAFTHWMPLPPAPQTLEGE